MLFTTALFVIVHPRKSVTVYVHFYFIGSQINANASVFFARDAGFGKRLLTFSSNSIPTKVIPLFSAEASTDPDPGDQNFFGDYLIYDNGFSYNSGLSWTGTVNNVGNRFDDYFSNPIYTNPYGDGVMATMFEQTVGSSVPPQYVGNDMSLGIGWFKYGSLPDAKFYMWLPNDNLSIDGCTYQVSPDQILIPGLPGPHVNNVENTTSLNPQISSVYTWYKNGVVQTGFTTYNPFLPVTHTGIPETWTCEMIVDDPGNSGWFHQYKYRDDIVLKGSIPTVSISAASLNICPNDFITFDANPLNPGITPTYQWTSSVRGPVGSNSSTLTLGSFTNNETIIFT